VRHEHHVGAISGTVLSISTLGSFLGAVATAVILLNFFGVAWTVVINYMALSLIVILLVFQRKKQWILIPILVIASVIIYMMNVNFEKKQFILTNQYSDYMLLNNYEHPVMGKGKLFIVNASPSSFLTQENKAFPYAEMVKHILFNKLKLTNKEILVIGAGGFSLSAEGTNGNQFYYNDIDSDMAKAAKSGFVKKINGTFIPGDARPFLKYNTKKFDVIISDAFNSRQSIPFYLLTQEHMRNIKKAINPGGYAMFNIIANPTFSTSYSKRVDNTIRSVFKNCVAIPVDYANKPTNIVYVCYMAKNTGDTTIYTDDKNSVSLDFYRR